MSRIGKQPIAVPNKVQVTIDGAKVSVKGPKGELSRELPSQVSISQEGDILTVTRQDESRVCRQMHGLSRSLVSNMVEGVSQGFQRKLQLQGVGYRAQLKGRDLVLSVGYSHPVEIAPPDGIQFAVEEKGLAIVVSGYDKEVVGNTTAKIRAVRPPEPYKGKGVRYENEIVRRKAGKAGKGGKK
ncbi:MAG: 50S ribosomal protein L6 [Rivularia sp. (in: cyanobacteria)]